MTLLVVLYFVSLCALGLPIARIFVKDPILKGFASFAVGFFLAGLLHFTLAMLDFVYLRTLLIVPVLSLVSAAFYFRDLIEIFSSAWSFIREKVIKRDKFSTSFLISAGLLLLGLLLLAWLPARSADAMRYHLAQLKDIVSHHGLIFRPYYCYNFPMYFGMGLLPLYAFFGHAGILLAVYGTFLLSLFLILRLSTILALKSTRLLFFVFVLLPISVNESTITANDFAVVLFVLIGFLLIMELDRSRPFVPIVFGFLALGLAVGVKYQAVLFIPWFLFLGRDCFDKESSFWRWGGGIVLGVAVTLGLSVPFFLRNYYHTGAPLWPLLQNIFVSDPGYLHEMSTAYGKRLSGSFNAATLSLSFKRFFTYPLLPCTVWIFAWPAVFVNRRSVFRAGQGFLVFYGIWFLLQPLVYWRFGVYVMPIALLFWIKYFEQLLEQKKLWLGRVYGLGLAVTLLFSVAIDVVYVKGFAPHVLRLKMDEFHKETWYYQEYQWMNKHLTKDDKILLLPFCGHSYYLDREYLRADPMLSGLFDWRKIKDLDAFFAKAKELKVNYIFYDDRDWSAFLAGKATMRVMKEVLTSNRVEIVWKKEPKLYTSRVRGIFIKANVYLLKIK